MHRAIRLASTILLPALLAAVGVASEPLPTTIEDFKLPGTQPGMAEPIIDPDQGGCTTCHNPDPIAPEWQGTMMANASIDPVFEACLAIAEQDAPGSGDLCLRCHIPKAWLEGRSTPTNGSAVLETDKSGVSCNFCHRMVNAVFIESPGSPELGSPAQDLGILAPLASLGEQPRGYGNGMYVVQPDNGIRDGSLLWSVMRGPRQTTSPGHDVLVSPFHSESDFCGTCHDVSNPAYVRNAAGRYVPNAFNQRAADPAPEKIMPIERTYSEWLNSEFAVRPVYVEGYGSVQTCQDCHMRGPPGKACYMGGVRDDVANHDLTGGNFWVPSLLEDLTSDPARKQALREAASRAVKTLQRAARLQVRQDGADLRVTVTNLTGHKLPTGYPEGRRMWLQVFFKDKDGETIKASGDYDFNTGELTEDPELKVYETKLGIDRTVSALTGIPEGHGFHFVLNNVVLKDNRIPPRGFTNEAFRSFGGAPVDYLYRDGQNADVTVYAIPLDAASVFVGLYYQTASKEYIEFLRDKNVTNDKGRVLHKMWLASKSPPYFMATETVELNALTTVFVHRNASGAGSGTNWEDAFTDLEEALEAARDNECIHWVQIAGGNYTHSSPGVTATFRIRGGLRVSGGYGQDENGTFLQDPDRFPTILNGGGRVRHVVTIVPDASGLPAWLSHVTVRGGNADQPGGEGGGIRADGVQLELQACQVLGNSARLRGGGILSRGARLGLQQCAVRGNSAMHGGGVWFEGSQFSAAGSTFDDNAADGALGGGGALYGQSGTMVFTSSAFLRNTAAEGAALFVGAAVLDMKSCTMTANVAGVRGGGLRLSAAGPNLPASTIVNSILWANDDSSGNGTPAQISSDRPYSIERSCVADDDPTDGLAVPGAGNVDGDPLLLNPQLGLVGLRTGSPCIDSGDSSRALERLDLAGRPRRVDDPQKPDSGVGPTPIVDMGAVELTRIIYVDRDATGLVEDGRTWRSAYRELRDALEETLEPGSQIEEVRVAEGYYRPAPASDSPDRAATFRLREGLALRGGYAGEDGEDGERDPALHLTVLSGDLNENDNVLRIGSSSDNSRHVVTAMDKGAQTILDGFTIQAGNADLRGALGGDQGGGLLVDHAVLDVTDCHFAKSSASSRGGGAAVVNGGFLRLERCTFRSNKADAGGGLAVANSSVRLSASSLYSNVARNGSGGGLLVLKGSTAVLVNTTLTRNFAFRDGGAVYTDAASLQLRSSSLAGNQAREATGGVVANGGGLIVANSILWGNTDGVGDLPGAQLAGASTVLHSCIEGGWVDDTPTEAGNIGLDPMFVNAAAGDLRLTGASPCIDAGDNNSLSVDVATDFLGNPRRHDHPDRPDTGIGTAPIVDMGAFELDESMAAEDEGDANGDGRVGRDDAASFWAAMTGPLGIAGSAGRRAFDADRDRDIDLVDFVAFQHELGTAPATTGPEHLHLRVTSDGASRLEAAPGSEVHYEVRAVLAGSNPQNRGLASVFFDLSFSGGPLPPADFPVDGPMRSFMPLEGLTNPAGFGGTPIDGALVQVGGAQNTVGLTSSQAPFPVGRVVPGVGREELVIARGSLLAPGERGTYRLHALNMAGAVLVAPLPQGAGAWSVGQLLAGDAGDLVVEVASAGEAFRRADANGDGRVAISDPTATLAAIFLGSGRLACLDAADANDDGNVDISDAVATLGYLFLGTRAPPPPGVDACASDPTRDELGCDRYDVCQP